MTVEQLRDRLHEEALAENEERNWCRTGRIRCADCGTMIPGDRGLRAPDLWTESCQSEPGR